MSSIGLLYTLDLVSFLEILPDNVYIPKKQMSVIMETKWLLDGRAINVQNLDDCGVYCRVFS